jgi:hypothetical protein
MKASFKVNDFLSTAYAGLSRPNRFEINMGTPPCIKEHNSDSHRRMVNIMCKTAYLPQTRVITSRNQYFSSPIYRPVGVDYGGDNLSLVFYVDSDMIVKTYFDEWVDGIVDRLTGITRYPEFYQTNLEIHQLKPGKVLEQTTNVNGSRVRTENSKDDVVYTAKFEDVFPVSVNPLTLDQGNNNVVHELSVTFNYRRWTWSSVDPYVKPK